jgi:hypothetical protein
MALYRFSTTPVSRSKGDGVIRRADYNGRDKLEDERTGKVWVYFAILFASAAREITPRSFTYFEPTRPQSLWDLVEQLRLAGWR